jgi:hypothetical protein
MLVVSLSLAAVLLARGGSGDASVQGAASGTAAPASPGAVPAATQAPSLQAPVAPIPLDLKRRLDALPEKLRQETLGAYAAEGIGLAQIEVIVTQHENRNPNVRVGSVLAVSEHVLRFEVFTTGEDIEITTGPETLVRRGDRDIALEDLLAGELVMVVTTDDGRLALAIEALGVSAP